MQNLALVQDENQIEKMFNYNGNTVRTVVIDGEPWFIAKDVSDVLGIENHRNATSRLSERMKDAVHITDSIGRLQQTTVISEPGVYKLIFQSRKPEAERFGDWVAEEVLPSIRQTGSYSVQPLSMEDIIIRQMQTMKALKADIKTLEEKTNLAHLRINNLDKIDLDGNERQQLTQMVKKYAYEKGMGYDTAWREFKRAFNTVYKTNLTRLINEYKKESGLDKVTTPEYLERTDKILDAIRLMDKMLNGKLE